MFFFVVEFFACASSLTTALTIYDARVLEYHTFVGFGESVLPTLPCL